MRSQPTLETERLILRPFELKDAGAVQRLAGDRAVADTTTKIPYPYADGVAEAWISTHRTRFEAEESCIFAVTLKADAALVGAVGFVMAPEFRRAEMGYWIGKSYWGRGYCTEAAHAVLHYGFSALNLHRVHAMHFTRNPASGAVMRKLGLIHEGCFRQHVRRWEHFEDLELYGILREEWANSRKPRVSAAAS